VVQVSQLVQMSTALTSVNLDLGKTASKKWKQFGEKAHGYSELAGECKGTTSNFVKNTHLKGTFFF